MTTREAPVAGRSFDFGSLPARFAGGPAGIAVTWNASEISYGHWPYDALPRPGPVPILAGIVLRVAWAVRVRAVFRAPGRSGPGLATAFFSPLVRLVVDPGAVPTSRRAMGMSWSHIRRRLSGRRDVDHVEED